MSQKVAHTRMTPLQVLQKYWGYDSFRSPQERIIQSVLAGTDTLALLPTGGGKSICFQVPALMRPGLCLVVSPLIALMKDQVYNLVKRNIPAKAIFSGMSAREIDITLDNCVHGNVKFLYVSPERLKTDLFLARLKQMPVSLLAIDEAHCISQWGYDFRPPYLEIADIRPILDKVAEQRVPALALTASATPRVQDDIMDKLRFHQGQRFTKSFARDNLSYMVYPEDNKPGKLVEIFTKVQGTGLVYVRNRRKTKQVAEWLQKAGIAADHYHAGLEATQRARRQENWISGKTRVMVCTNAFGMGIDKPDVRAVIHIDIPDSLEAYYQEAGRAGRDGQRSYVALLYDPNNTEDLKSGVARKFPDLKFVRKVYQALGDYYQLAMGSGAGYTFDFDVGDFCRTYRLPVRETYRALQLLEAEGLLLATDAVYLSPRVKVTATRQQLYELEVANRRLDPLIKMILRSYEGAFDHYVKINEKQMARLLHLTVEELRKFLKELQQKGYIHYEPYKDKPQLVFLRPRQDTRHFMGIDTQRLGHRKKIYTQQVEAVLKYVFNRHQCRQQFICRYFGEQEVPPCGRCDVCKGKKQTGVALDDFEAMEAIIKAALAEGPVSLTELTGRAAHYNSAHVTEVLRWMTDHGLVQQDVDGTVRIADTKSGDL